jgi:formylglycine-generating enzyme required for sulfatase activity
LEVTGGTYYRTYDAVVYDAGVGVVPLEADGGPTGEADPATVSSFRLDKYLVTVGRFRQFVNAFLPPDGGAGWVPPAGSGKHTYLNNGNGLNATGGGYEPGWVAADNSNIAPTDTNLTTGGACGGYDTWTNTAGTQENLPINCVNWYEAYAFCIWDGGFLPSEAEWEYAAAGGSQQREYPWGSTAPGTGSQYAIYDCNFPNGSGSLAHGASVANIAQVGTATLGAGLWGQLDMAGELWEWNIDWYAAYVASTDCADFTASSQVRVTRGGDFIDDASFFPYRGGGTPATRGGELGFRCARTP